MCLSVYDEENILNLLITVLSISVLQILKNKKHIYTPLSFVLPDGSDPSGPGWPDQTIS